MIQRTDGFTALHLAIFGGQEDAARVLIEHGTDGNQLSTSKLAQMPPLGTAAVVRSRPLAQLLLDAGADVNGREESGPSLTQLSLPVGKLGRCVEGDDWPRRSWRASAWWWR